MSDEGVHFNKALDIKIKQMCQREWESRHDNDRDAFIKTFGRNYL